MRDIYYFALLLFYFYPKISRIYYSNTVVVTENQQALIPRYYIISLNKGPNMKNIVIIFVPGNTWWFAVGLITLAPLFMKLMLSSSFASDISNFSFNFPATSLIIHSERQIS